MRINDNIKVWCKLLFRNSVMFNPHDLSTGTAKKRKIFYLLAPYDVHQTFTAK